MKQTRRASRASPERGPETRIERVIAAGRVALAAFSYLGVWLDPSEPTMFRTATYAMLAGYLAYSLVLAIATWSVRTVPRGLPLITHTLDLIVFVVFMYLTSGPNSPFFAYFTFATVSGTLRWHWRGAAITASISLLAFLGVGWLTSQIAEDPFFELNRFIIRSVYLVVVAVLLGYLGASAERRRREIGRLATWPDRPLVDEESLVTGLLEHASRTLRAPRVLLVWEDADEPWTNFALHASSTVTRWQEAPAADPLVADALADTDFFCDDITAAEPAVLRQDPDGSFSYWYGRPISARILGRTPMTGVVGIRLPGRAVSGHLFFLGVDRATSDTIVLGQVVGQQAATALDHHVFGRRQRGEALFGARIRMSQDIHDGVLQSLTGIGLRLQALETHLAADPDGARKEVHELKSLVMDEQRDLRVLVTELSDDGAVHGEQFRTLADRLQALADRVERVWRVRVDRDIAALDHPFPAAFTAAVSRMLHEAIVNAVRHGQARSIYVSGTRAPDGSIVLTVADDGSGFPFHGHYEHARLVERRLGPASLRERAEALGGAVSIDSSDRGATLEIRLPSPPGTT